MKKIVNFIVEKRYFILILFLILTSISFILSSKVNINYDITKYLPSSSQVKTGMNIMNKEFKSEISTLNIMVDKIENKDELDNYLNSFDDVTDIEYEDKDNYTLITLTLNLPPDSKEAKKIYTTLNEYFEDSLYDTSGNVSDYNKTVLPFYIVVLAVGCALIILIIMCESYVEPFLFLISILIAVVLNSGSNIIFSSVSNVTNSICAILQMALSMDYSIMLMNRYRQERLTESNKIEAMKKALYHSFKAISSSSVTTIVGLIALVFMSFTIGRDLGFVLAKGVLFSLISIFTVLPCLILMCDKLIYKTKKKSPFIKLDFIGKISYKCRHIALILFILIFISSYFLKGNLGIVYTQSGTSEIEKTFKLNNQMAIIYKNKDEDIISKYCNELENNTDSVLCYSNTINMPLKYNELNSKFEELGKNIKVDDYLLKIVYYHYNNKKENNVVKLNDLINFIKNDVYNNDKFNKDIENIKGDIELLSNFIDTNKLRSPRTIEEISDTLNISENIVNDLLIYNNSKNIANKLTINEFISFMNNYVLTQDKYKNSVDEKTKDSLNNVSKFINKDKINTKSTSDEIAKLFGIDENSVNNIYTYYLINSEIEDKLSLYEFATFTSKLFDSEYGYLFDEDSKESIDMLKTFSNKEFINTKMDLKDLANTFKIQEGIINILVNALFKTTDIKLSPYEFITSIVNNKDIYNILGAQKEQVNLLYSIMDSTNNDIKYNYQELSIYLNTLGSKIDDTTLKSIYSLYLSSSLKLSPYEFVNFIISNKDSEKLNSIDQNTLSLLTQLKNIMDGVLNDTKYTAKQLSNVLKQSEDDLKLIYSLYSTQNKKLTISYQDFISLLINDILTQDKYKNNFDDYSRTRLTILDGIIKDSLNNKKYTKDELYTLLSGLSSNLDKNLIDLVYIYYGSVNEYDENWTFTIEEFSRYLNEEILKDTRFDNYIDDDMKQDIIDSKESVKDAKDMLIGNNYSRIVLNTKLKPESDETFKFIKKIKSDLDKKTDEFYVIGDSPMALEMSETFNNELNFITILTMIFIFIIVVITFKSILIPIILVLLIQCAVFLTMGILSFTGTVYFISILIVQSILMGATIDYAILYTSYYLESRKTEDIKTSIINAYNNSIHTILTSALVLIIVTFIVGKFSSAVAAKICMTLSQGTLCSALLILILLPSVISACDKFIMKNKRHKK